jgi:sn1-specific diacylglycerol lipase
MIHETFVCRCSCCPCARFSKSDDSSLMEVLDDNCCGCNVAAYRHMCDLPRVTLVYVTYHVDMGETPFLVAVDYEWKTIVVSIRGTLSLKV